MNKCFCHFNGYEVKDAKARKEINSYNTVNILTLGATGDGINDDTQYIQQAVNNYQNIIIPLGYTFLSGEITISKEVHIYGGGTLKHKEYNLLNITGNNCLIENIKIEGNNQGFSIYGIGDYLTVRSCYFEGDIDHYINVKGKYSNILNNTFDGTKANNIITSVVFGGAEYFECNNNTFVNGIGFNIQTRLNAKYGNIKNNKFNNVIYKDSQVATSQQTSFTFTTDKVYKRYNIHVNNEIVGYTSTNADNVYTITLDNPANIGDIIEFVGCMSLENININSNSYNINIDGNIMNGSGDSGIVICADYHNGVLDPENSDETDVPENISVTNNHIKNVFYSGIAETHHARNVVISNNVIESCCIGLKNIVSTYNSCIFVSSAKATVSNNSLTRNNSDYQMYGICMRANSSITKNRNKNVITVSGNIYNGDFVLNKTGLANPTPTQYHGYNDQESKVYEYPMVDLSQAFTKQPNEDNYWSFTSMNSGVQYDNTNTYCGEGSVKTWGGNNYTNFKPKGLRLFDNAIVTLSYDCFALQEGGKGYVKLWHRSSNVNDFQGYQIDTIENTKMERHYLQVITNDVGDLRFTIGSNDDDTGNIIIQNIKIEVQYL